MATNLLVTRSAFESIGDQYNQINQVATGNQMSQLTPSSNNWRCINASADQRSFTDNVVSTSLGALESDSYAVMDEQSSSSKSQPVTNRGAMKALACFDCRQEINDRYLYRIDPDMTFHRKCTKCWSCEKMLDDCRTAFFKEGHLYCKDDYNRLFRRKCNRCERILERTDLVLRAGDLIYHTACFSCQYCERKLNTGENFLIRSEEVFCGPECADPRSSSTRTEAFAREEDDCWDSSTLTSLDNHLTSTPPLSLRSPRSDEVITTMPGSSNVTLGGPMKKNKKDKQATRIRTVLNEKQLLTLKTCYSANSRPDAVMKEQLVELTGLSARVIRVWFQNKRCKDKKRQQAMRHMHQRAETERAINGVRMSGVGPLIAASPTRYNDPNMANMQPIEINQYTQNSAAWSNVESVELQHQLPPHVSLAQMRQQFPTLPSQPYAELNGGVAGYGVSANLNYGANMEQDFEYSPHVNSLRLTTGNE